MIRPTKPTKAWVAGAIAALSYLAPVAGDGISLPEVLWTAGFGLAAFQGVYWTTNKAKAEKA
jgi:hypothetical protein